MTNTCQSICGKPSDCKKGLTCDEGKGVCFSQPARECAKSVRCRMDGSCSLVDGKCKATKDEDYAKTCKFSGLCSFIDGKCSPTKDEDCAKSVYCKNLGSCSAVDGECKATKDEHCSMSVMCKMEGWCSRVDGKCRE